MRITYLPKVDQRRASSRYRQIIPGLELEKLGHTVYYVDGHRNSEWVIVNKAVGEGWIHASSGWMGYHKMCFDMCDNHFTTEWSENHVWMCKKADIVTCSTTVMRDEIFKHTGREAQVIEDPVEFDIKPPVNVNELNSVFWCGNNLSAPALEATTRINFGGVSGVFISIGTHRYHLYAVGASDYFWSMDYSEHNMISGLTHSDVAIIPVDNSAWARCKSPNRMMGAIARGVFVIAEPMPAYEQFKEWMWVGNIEEGLSWAKNNLSKLSERVKLAQDYVVKHHSPHTIGKKWEMVLCG